MVVDGGGVVSIGFVMKWVVVRLVGAVGDHGSSAGDFSLKVLDD